MKTSRKTALLAFVPVLHKGYVDFFNSHEGDIYIFGEEIVSLFKYLTRDIRAVEPSQMKDALSAVLPGRNIKIAQSKDFESWEYENTVMPDDEVCHDVSSKYLEGKKVEFVSVFLRWNRLITLKEHEIPGHRKISKDEFHRKFMSSALSESEKSADWWRQVGAVVVKEDKVIYSAHNHHLPSDFHLVSNGDPRSNFDAGEKIDLSTAIHGEAEIIAKAAKDGVSLAGSSIYVTTFPCPVCARLIGTAGIKRVFYSKGYSLLDGEKILNSFDVEIIMVD